MMDNRMKENKVHWSFWAISVSMLIWNLMGCINFFVQMNPDMVASYQETEQAIIQDRPTWATAAFAIAVFGGALGCLLLMLRNSIAFYLFIASLLGVLVTMAHTLGAGIDFGTGELIGIIFMPVAVAVFLVWYLKYTQSKGWVVS
jgi:hypothetical protein